MKIIRTLLILLLCFCGCVETNNDYNNDIYTPSKNVIEVESIEWNTLFFEEQKGFEVKKYSLEDKKDNNYKYDGELICSVFDFTEPLMINIKCVTRPNNATYSTLQYFVIDLPIDVETLNVEDNSIDITFKNTTAITVLVSTIDQKTTYTIRIHVISYSSEII